MNKYITEFIGTFFLVLIIGITNNPIAIGIGLSVLVYMGAHISGAPQSRCIISYVYSKRN